MTEVSEQVPEEAVVAWFSGVMAISPQLYKQRVERLAQSYGVECDNSFKAYVSDVLRRQPPADFD